MDRSNFFEKCYANPDLFQRMFPETDDAKDIAKLCLVNTAFRDFLFSTIQGRQVWLTTASLATGFDGFSVIDIRVSDFKYQLKLLFCPWLSKRQPLFFEIPEVEWATDKDLRVLNKTRLLFRASNHQAAYQVENEHSVISFSGLPLTTEGEFNKTMTVLPYDFPDVDAPEIPDDLDFSTHDMIPDYLDCESTLTRVVHDSVVAVLAIHTGFEGSVYFVSSRDYENPVILRHFVIPLMGDFMDIDLCSRPQMVWLMTADCVFYMGPQPTITHPLLCDTEDSKIGRMTPALIMAAEGDAAGVLEYMGKTLGGLNINTPSLMHNRTVLFYAVQHDQLEAVKDLVASGADVNATDSLDAFPMMFATRTVNAECVKLLFDHGAKISNNKKASALHSIGLVEKKGADEMIKVLDLLFAAGANPNEPNLAGRTLLFRTDVLHDPKIFRYMITKGADPKIRDINGDTILHACRTNIDSMRVIVKHLGVDVNAQNNEGNTALHENIFHMSAVEVKVMVEELKADPRIKNNHGHDILKKYNEFMKISHMPESTKVSDILLGGI